MFKNYIKIALRNLWKERTFTTLNVVGLTAAFGVAILLTMYAVFQLSFDQFHESSERIFQVYNQVSTPDGLENDTTHSEPFSRTIKEEVSGMESLTRLRGNRVLLTFEGKQLPMSASYVDPSFLDIFTFPIVKGTTTNPIESETSIAITEIAAKRIFGKEKALGETVTVLADGEEKSFVVSAILKDFPDTSTLSFDVLINFKSQSYHSYERIIGDWSKENHRVYVKLSENIDVSTFEKSTIPFTKLHYQNDMANAKRDGAQADANGMYRQVKLLPITGLPISIKKLLRQIERCRISFLGFLC